MPTSKLLVIVGPPLHGKTTFGRKAAETKGRIHLDIDDIKVRHWPHAADGARDAQGNFDLAADVLISIAGYQILVHEIWQALQSRSVVVTGTFSKYEMRRPLLDFLNGSGNDVPHQIIRIGGELRDEEVQRRCAARKMEGSNSPIDDPDKYRTTLKFQGPWEIDITELDVNDEQILSRVMSHC